jgi:hypothetical protein
VANQQAFTGTACERPSWVPEEGAVGRIVEVCPCDVDCGGPVGRIDLRRRWSNYRDQPASLKPSHRGSDLHLGSECRPSNRQKTRLDVRRYPPKSNVIAGTRHALWSLSGDSTGTGPKRRPSGSSSRREIAVLAAALALVSIARIRRIQSNSLYMTVVASSRLELKLSAYLGMLPTAT